MENEYPSWIYPNGKGLKLRLKLYPSMTEYDLRIEMENFYDDLIVNSIIAPNSSNYNKLLRGYLLRAERAMETKRMIDEKV